MLEPVPLTSRFDAAVAFALDAHRLQPRKATTVPYVSHLFAACSIVLDAGGDEDEAIAALLHDAAEDQGGWPTLQKIKRQFGERVAEIVAGCTDTYEALKEPWRPRKEAYVERLARESASVRLVAAADKLHNLRATVSDLRRKGPSAMLKFDRSPTEVLWYYRACIDAVANAIPYALRYELEWTRAEFEMLLVLPRRAAPPEPAGGPRR